MFGRKFCRTYLGFYKLWKLCELSLMDVGELYWYGRLMRRWSAEMVFPPHFFLYLHTHWCENKSTFGSPCYVASRIILHISSSNIAKQGLHRPVLKFAFCMEHLKSCHLQMYLKYIYKCILNIFTLMCRVICYTFFLIQFLEINGCVKMCATKVNHLVLE